MTIADDFYVTSTGDIRYSHPDDYNQFGDPRPRYTLGQIAAWLNHEEGEFVMEEDYPHNDECAAESPMGAIESVGRQLVYQVKSQKIVEIFRAKSKQCLQIAAEHSGQGDDMCHHGIVVAYEGMAEQYELRADQLKPGVYEVGGELLSKIFAPVDPPNPGLEKMAQALDRAPRMPNI